MQPLQVREDRNDLGVAIHGQELPDLTFHNSRFGQDG